MSLSRNVLLRIEYMRDLSKNAIVDHLLSNMDQIFDASDWERLSGIEKNKFNTISFNYFGQKPAYVLSYMRMLTIVEDLHQNPGHPLATTAQKAGLSNSHKLNDFVREYLGITASKLKKKVVDETTYVKVVRVIMNYAGLEMDVDDILANASRHSPYA